MDVPIDPVVESSTIMKRRFRLATYNVLSSSLCSPSYFTYVADEKFCSSKYRFEGLLSKLRPEVDKKTIICLQEVSLQWSAKLHTFMDANGYNFVVSNYGHRANGYMGVGIAYPRSEYILANTELVCAADTKVGGWSEPRSKDKSGVVAGESMALVLARKAVSSVALPFTMFYHGLGAFFTQMKKLWIHDSAGFPRRNDSPWDLARNRSNTMVSLRLRAKDGPNDDSMDFIVATYHLPCQFWEPATMTIHTTICLQELQKQAEGKYPHVLAGDFNFKPHSPPYEFVTKGIFSPTVNDPSDPELDGKASTPAEPLYPGDPFTYTLPRGPMRSAYTEVFGKEPRFTNFAMTGTQTKPFCDTLDYIFFRDGEKFKGKTSKLSAVDALDITPICDDIQAKQLKSLPSETEYSDHLMLAAEFQLSRE